VTPNEEPVLAAIAQQAGEWFIAHQAGQLPAEDCTAFLAWLRASPIHVQEYLGVARVAHELRAAVGNAEIPLESFLAEAYAGKDNVAVLERPALERPAARFSFSRLLPAAASLAAAVLAVTLATLWWVHDGERFGIPKAYRTAHGEQTVRQLPDGSIMHLDTDSTVIVRYSGRERVVDIHRGQALFQVAHEGSRRFRVVAGAVGVIAVGTEFDVYRTNDTTVVTVAEGQVAVFTGEPAWLWGAGGTPADVQRVKAGYQVRVDGGVLSAQPVPVDLHQVLGWLQHKIVFEHRPLGEVAAEFNRYARVPVEIEDTELRALPVSGTFDADDTASFVAFLETLPGVRVERTVTRIRVLRETPPRT
jgi:transmembrane sensor